LTSISLDGTWEFIPDPASTYRVENLPAGRPIMVPGSWEAQAEQRFGVVHAWYRRRLTVPASWAGQAIMLRFGAVMYSAEVWLDGVPVGEHEGGYTPFTVDITPRAIPGREHTLVLRVSNPLNALTEYPSLPMDEVLYAKDRMGRLPLSEAPHGKQTWYSSLSGIWQSVELQAVPDCALDLLRVRAEPDDPTVEVQWRLRQTGSASAVRLRLLDPQGRQVARRSVQVGAETQQGTIRLAVSSPQAWDVDRPNLYSLEVQVNGRSGSSHEQSLRFGFRRIESRDARLFLNGAPLLIRGALDQDLYPEGLSLTGASRDYYVEQFRLAKEMGLNLIRCHIKLPDPAYLDAADEAGILLWCELPNWSQFSSRAASTGRAMLQTMVETMGHHPSIIIWTVINEDWGTRLRDEARDRRWLLGTCAWLKALDPGRLVVDNSACDSQHGKPNFHLSTDILDFHEYFSMPDKAIRWRNLIADFANRPSWLWSPHGDARPRGDEPLILSEFGNWGLPDISRLDSKDGADPWWFATGRQLYQPGGALERFRHFGLERVWRDWTAMASATQERQFEALQFEVGELRRHSAISGYVITEFTDAYWEANGLLDIARRPKVFHGRLAELNGPEILIADLARHDWWSAEELAVDLTASSFVGTSEPPSALLWRLRIDDRIAASGKQPLDIWPVNGPAHVATLRIELPKVDASAQARLEVDAVEPSGRLRARGSWALAILPASRQRTSAPRRVAIEDPLDIWGLEDRIRELGHQPVPLDEAELLITSELTMAGRRHAEEGGRVLVLVRSRTALPPEVELQREIIIHPRWLTDHTATDPRNPWRGDWISAFSWIDPALHPDLPRTNPLDFAFQEVIPDHVLRGYHPQRHASEVSAGMFVGWVHAPAALLWSFAQGRGQMTVTTFKLAPEHGPIATILLEELIQGGQLSAERQERSTAALVG
jgi:hypothetical protein